MEAHKVLIPWNYSHIDSILNFESINDYAEIGSVISFTKPKKVIVNKSKYHK